MVKNKSELNHNKWKNIEQKYNAQKVENINYGSDNKCLNWKC